MDNSKFILPIFIKNESHSPFLDGQIFYDELFVGNGFIVGNFFISAGHVLCQSRDPYIKLENKELYIHTGKKVILQDMPYNDKGNPIGHENPQNADLAIYEFDDLEFNSPLCLSDSLPKLGQSLQSCFYHYKPDEIEKILIAEEIEDKAIKDKTLIYWNSTGIVNADPNDHCGDFFEATMTPVHPWGGGSSGSPILDGYKVYGILHAGGAKKNPEICVYFSAQRALQAIEKFKRFSEVIDN